ncbi:hypothetical protein LWI29_029826 [Acer saccharum]|uniref:Uncharacterized protein n=1 Tax=Acer saccharum TaxID=4024 RepID=A0AA39RX24_ACESA|nr:hypothetical protein LWI29_029826 [Acer saccharum]
MARARSIGNEQPRYGDRVVDLYVERIEALQIIDGNELIPSQQPKSQVHSYGITDDDHNGALAAEEGDGLRCLVMGLMWMVFNHVGLMQRIVRRRFDRGRLLVLISHDRPCPRKIKVDYGEGSFSLKIIEDGMPVDLAWLENHLGLIKILQHANLKVVQTKGGAVSMDSKVSGNVASLADEGVSGDVSKSDQLIGVCPLQCYGKPKVIGKRAIKGKAFEFKGESNLLGSRSNNIGCLDRSVAEKSRCVGISEVEENDQVEEGEVSICMAGRKGGEANDTCGGAIIQGGEVLGSSGSIGGFVDPCVRRGGGANDKGEASMIGCLEKRDIVKPIVSKLDSKKSVSLGRSVFIDSNDVFKIGKGRVVKASGVGS